MELLNSYKNGNVLVTIYTDGTKVQEWPDGEAPKPIFPNSFDLKITDYCDLNCVFCHEMSTTRGKEGDLSLMSKLVNSLPAGTEIAIGGGNPLSHSNLKNFLKYCSDKGLICNLTVNHKHILPYYAFIDSLLENKLIYGLGVSIDRKSNLRFVESLYNTDNIVYHVIAGVDSIDILDKIMQSNIKKVLVLGYKEVGRGINYYDEKVEERKTKWFKNIHKYIGKVHLSFDNLAIKQLNIRRFFNKSSWDLFYMGNDGAFTFYIDLPNEEYALSSTSPVRYKLESSIEEMFSKIRNS